jgi:hypothetical protein
MTEHPHKDNWLAVAKVRDQAEAANPEPNTIAEVIDRHHHEF